jgi:propane monooxygenase small subunit
MGAGESDTARELRGARALFGMLAGDEEHGKANRKTMQRWLDDWTPRSLAAARQMQPIWSQISEKVVRFEDSLEHATGHFDELTSALQLSTPKEVAR